MVMIQHLFIPFYFLYESEDGGGFSSPPALLVCFGLFDFCVFRKEFLLYHFQLGEREGGETVHST